MSDIADRLSELTERAKAHGRWLVRTGRQADKWMIPTSPGTPPDLPVCDDLDGIESQLDGLDQAQS